VTCRLLSLVRGLCLPAFASTSAAVLGLCLLPQVPAQASGPPAALYRAEEFLAWAGAADDTARKEAERLLRERHTLIARQEAQDFELVPTPFGDRPDEPEEVLEWRRQEHRKLLALIPKGRAKEFEKFREDWRRQAEAARTAFPLLPKPPISLQTTDDGEKMTVDLIIGAPSSLFALEIDEVKETDEGVEVRATWVRPPASALVGKAPETAQVARRAEFARKGKLVVWLRTRDEDLPFRTAYQKLLAVPLGQ